MAFVFSSGSSLDSYCLLAFLCVCVHVLVYGWRLGGLLDHGDEILIVMNIVVSETFG